MEKPSPPYEYPASEGLQLDERRMPPITQLQPDHADDKAPLVFYSIEGKEVVPKNGQTGKRYCGLTPAVFWIILIVVILLVVGGAVGAGVGISLAGKSKHSLLSNRYVGLCHPLNWYFLHEKMCKLTLRLNSITPSPSPLSTLENDISSPSEITSESTSTSSTSSPSPTCPTTLRLCAFDATCSGRNNPLNQVGTCADGCTCKSTCGAINGLCTT